MIEILHVSDTHGHFPLLDTGGVDLIVHSGDFLPSFSWGDRAVEFPRQLEWLRANADRIAEWLGGKPCLFVCGNHEFVPGGHIESVLRRAGCKFTDLTCRSDEIAGLKWYGLPFVPAYGTWNYGCCDDELVARTSDAIHAEPDILVAHCPPWAVLDAVPGSKSDPFAYNWDPGGVQHIGNKALAAWLRRDDVKKPRLILCGHVHESHGGFRVGNTIVSNAATVAHRIVLP